MKNSRKQPIDYHIAVAITKDWQAYDETRNIHPLLKEAGLIKHRVMVSLSKKEFDEFNKKQGLSRDLWIRARALELIQKK